MGSDIQTPSMGCSVESWRLLINRLIAEGRFVTR